MAYADATRQALLPAAKPLDCPDCGVSGALQIGWKPDRVGGTSRVEYRCVTPKCRGYLPARADGSPVGKPGNAITRSARKVLQERLGDVWRQADAVASEMLVAAGKKPLRSLKARRLAQTHGRKLLYAWVAAQLRRGSSEARVAQMSLDDCDRISKALTKIGCDFRAVVAWSKGRRGRAKRSDGASGRRGGKAAAGPDQAADLHRPGD